MRLPASRVLVLLLSFVFLGSIAASNVNVEIGPSGTSEEPQPSAGTSPRTVLVEEFTAQWCPPCANAARALTRVEDEYGKTEIVVVAYHGSSDPFYDATMISARLRNYVNSTYYLPSVIVDGGGPGNTNALWTIGSGTPDSAYTSYTTDIKSRMAINTNLQITPEGDLTPTQAYAAASVYASDDVTETNLYITFVLYEDNMYYMGTNGNPLHRVVARALYEEPLVLSKGETRRVSHTFNLNGGWDKNKLGFVVFVQTHDKSAGWTYNTYIFYNAEVLQAAKWRYGKPGILYVRADEKTDYKEYMETPLTYNLRSFENWNVLDPADTGTKDVRGSPGPAEMEEFGAVLWVAGSNGTFSPTQLADVATYLDAGGNILVTGEDVAADIGLLNSTWLNDYLHASHGTDPVGATFVNGVAGDPITNQFSSTNMLIGGSSPDAVDPANGGIMILNYSGPVSAAVRADHATGSRTVLFGMNYFEGPDVQTNVRPLIENILKWLDGAAGPKVSLTSPNGGEVYSSGDTAVIEWHAVDVSTPVNAVDLYYTTNLTSPTWTPIASGEPNDGAFRWVVPSVTTTDCGIRIVVRDSDSGTPDGEDISDGPCTIGSPNISMTKTVSNPAPMVYDTVTYTITLINTGTTNGYATVEDRLPSAVTYISDDGGTSGATLYYSSNATVVWWVEVPSASSVTLNIDARVNFGPKLVQRFNYAFFNSTSIGGGSHQAGNSAAAFQIPSLESWSLPLTVGKHFISIPILMLDYDIEAVLSSIVGDYAYVRMYTGDLSDPWASYEPGRQFNDLQTLPHGSGFWIEIVTPCTLTVEGARSLGTTIDLSPGWNMVGYPSYSTTYTVADMKAALGLTGIRVEGFDAGAPGYNLQRLSDSYVMKTGEAYWVLVPSGATWAVPP